MLKIADAVRHMIEGNPLLLFGMRHELLNLTQVARYIEPLIKVRVKKKTETSAIAMALSRMQKEILKSSTPREKYYIHTIGIHTNLATFTFRKGLQTTRNIHKFAKAIQSKGGYFSVAEGMRETTVIVEQEHMNNLRKTVNEHSMYEHKNISGISIVFDEKYAQVPGMLYILMQQLLLQNINVIEVTSTFTSLVLYVDERDTQFAFDTLYGLFRKNGK